MMLQQPLDLVFKDPLKRQQALWLATTAVPLRSVSFDDTKWYGWDPLSARPAAVDRCFAGSRGTLQVKPVQAWHLCDIVRTIDDHACFVLSSPTLVPSPTVTMLTPGR